MKATNQVLWGLLPSGLLIYVLSYVALLRPSHYVLPSSGFDRIIRVPEFKHMNYKFGRWFYAPLITIDGRIRPNYWFEYRRK